MSSSIFLSCSNPYTVTTTKGSVLVPCGHCIQCLQKKVSTTTLLLDLESQSCKYVEMINLTYNDDCIPYLDFMDDSLCSFDVSRPTEVFYLKFGSSRRVRKYNPRTKSYYFVPESIKDFGVPVDSAWRKYLEVYSSRVDEYYTRFPERKRGLSRLTGHVPVLYSDDLRKYMYRLRQFISKNYGIKIRFFAIGEYGSNSLRPHWHILLFHDSDKLRQSFRDVVELPGHSKKNPRQCCRQLFDSSIWLFGHTTTKCTDKHLSSYLAGYFNQHASCSPLLADFPSKAYHSTLLGLGKLSQSQKSDFLKESWTSFVSRSLVSKQGVKKDVSVSSSLYSQLLPRFTGHATYNVDETYTLLSSVFSILKAVEVDYNDEVELYKFYLSLFNFNFTNQMLERSLSVLRDYVHDVVNPRLQDSKNPFTLSSLKSVFYASVKLYKNSQAFCVHPLTYLKKVFSFKSFIDYQKLVSFYELLQSSPVSVDEYYSSFASNGCLDFEVYKYKPIYLSMLSDATAEYYKSIKHREVVDSYINSQLDF